MMGEMLSLGFMRNALLAALLAAPLFGALGSLIVSRRMAFFSDALGHAALTGIAIGALLGLRNPVAAMTAFGVLFALLVVTAQRRGANSADATIGAFSSAALALGVVIMSLSGGFAKYSGVLIGDLLSVTTADLIQLGAALALTAAFLILFYNKLLLIGIDPALAKSRGINVGALEVGFAILVAVVVMLSIRWVGTLIINSMLVLPAAAARNLAKSSRGYMGLSVGIAMVAGVLGVVASYATGGAAGAMVVLVMAGGYFLTMVRRR